MRIKDDSGDRKYFTIIPNYILNHSTHWDREVYIQMKRIAGEQGTCWMSQKNLAKQCGMSVNRVKQSISYLVEHEWVKKIGTKPVHTKGGEQAVNEYVVIDLWETNNTFYKNKGVSPDDIPSHKGVSPKSSKGYHENRKGVSPESYKEEPIKEEPIKEDIADKSAGNKVSFKPQDKELAILLLEKIVSNTPTLKKPNIDQWSDIIRLMREKDERTYEQIKFVINWSQENNFWSANILSTKKLREKFDTLVAQIKRETTKDKINSNNIIL